MAAPGLAVVGISVVVPLLLALVMSFTHCSRLLEVQWAGLHNYRQILTDPIARISMRNTAIFTIIFVPLNLGAAIVVAQLLNRPGRHMKLVRGAFFVPVVVSMVVAVSVFRFLYDRDYGPLNAFLGLLGYSPVAWLHDPRFAMISIVLVAVWKSSALYAVIILAALQDVPQSLQDAAAIDGANAFRRYLHVTVPSIAPVLGASALLSSIGAFRVFVPMFVLTNGGPAHATRSLAQYAYETAFRDGRLGYASALSLVLMAVIAAVTAACGGTRRKPR
jgi:multiple sugar transport system permease protein